MLAGISYKCQATASGLTIYRIIFIRLFSPKQRCATARANDSSAKRGDLHAAAVTLTHHCVVQQADIVRVRRACCC